MPNTPPPDYLVLEQIIPESYQNWILDSTTNETLKWHINHNGIDKFRFLDDPRNGFAAFLHLYEIEHSPPEISPLYNAFIPLALTFIDIVNEISELNVTKLLRMRVNNVPIYSSNVIQLPHVDGYVDNSWNVVYYVDDADGETVIYNERAKNSQEYIAMVERDQWTELVRIQPKKGRAVAFKGDLFHSSTLPTTKRRLVLNANLV